MKRLAAVVVASLCVVSAPAAVQLTYMVRDIPTPIAWAPGSFPLRYTIDVQSAPLVANQAALRAGFASWEDPISQVRFTPNPPAPVQAGKDGINSVSITNELFKDSGFIAFTTTWFDDSGRIQEADIQVDPSVTSKNNLGALMQHEVGHLLGLDHSANLSATMYPFVGQAPHALTTDDQLGLTTLYPAQNLAVINASLKGEVRSVHGPVFGAQVVASDAAGSPVATTLTNRQGEFAFRALPPGSYRVYAEPLDGPVERRNLSGVYAAALTSFRTQYASEESVTIAAGESRELVLDVDTLAPQLNPRWVGVFPANSDSVTLSSSAATIQPGSTISIAVGGDGFFGGMTTFEVAGGAITRVSDFKYGSNYAYATFRVPPDAAPVPLVVMVASGNERAALTGALRVNAAGGRSRPVTR
jgi:hypothetical protein